MFFENAKMFLQKKIYLYTEQKLWLQKCIFGILKKTVFSKIVCYLNLQIMRHWSSFANLAKAKSETFKLHISTFLISCKNMQLIPY